MTRASHTAAPDEIHRRRDSIRRRWSRHEQDRRRDAARRRQQRLSVLIGRAVLCEAA